MVNVLLVEPSEKIRTQLTTALKRARINLEYTHLAEEALEMISRKSFKAVMMRSNLEGMSALAFLKILSNPSSEFSRPLVIIYGKLDVKKRMELWRSGADDVIEMPFVLPEVLLRLNVRLTQTGNPGKPASSLEENIEVADEVIPENLPLHGNVEKRPIPLCLSVLHLTRATGVIRFIEGRHLRAIYIEKGFIRGAMSSKKEENLYRLMLKWLEFPGDQKKQFKALPDTTPDPELARRAKQLCGFRDEAIDAIAVRYMHYVAEGAIHMTKGEYDWSPNETPDDMQLVKFRGLHPIHLLLTVIRDTSPAPNFKTFMPDQLAHLAPAGNHGVLRDTYRLTAPEMCVTALTANGITLANWLKQAEIILPYANAFIYIMLLFRVMTSVDRTKLRAEEMAAVSLPVRDISLADDRSLTMVDIDESSSGKQESPVTGTPISQASSTQKPSNTDKIQSEFDKVFGQSSPKPKVKTVQNDLDGVTEFDLRPVKSRVKTKPGKSPAPPPQTPRPKKTANPYKQDSTPQHKYDALRARLEKLSKKEVKTPGSLEFFNLDTSQLSSGHIWDTHPSLIMLLVMKTQQTGVLEFSDAASSSRLFWQNGRLVYAKSTKPSLRIDQVLFDLKLISEDQKQEAADLWTQYGGMRSGTGLFRQNIVSIMDLTDAVKEQIRLIIKDICTLPAGDYTFEAGPLPQDECIAFDIATERVIQQGIREMDSPGNLQRIIPDLSVRLTQAAGAAERAQEVQLEGIDIFVLNRFRKTCTAKSAFTGMDVSLQTFKNIVSGLYILDFLELHIQS